MHFNHCRGSNSFSIHLENLVPAMAWKVLIIQTRRWFCAWKFKTFMTSTTQKDWIDRDIFINQYLSNPSCQDKKNLHWQEFSLQECWSGGWYGDAQLTFLGEGAFSSSVSPWTGVARRSLLLPPRFGCSLLRVSSAASGEKLEDDYFMVLLLDE